MHLRKIIRKHVPWRSLRFFGHVSLEGLGAAGFGPEMDEAVAAESKSWMLVWCIGVSKIDCLKVGYLLGFSDVHECHLIKGADGCPKYPRDFLVVRFS